MGSRANVSVGSLLAGRYRLVEPLPGAVAGTWRARDDIGDRDVAARKLPLVRGEVQEAVRQRAMHEARHAARLRHAGIVPVYDVVEHDGVPWVVTGLGPAPSLDDLLRTRGPVPPVEAARIGLRVLEALEVADAAGVRHRDLTPACVLVGGDGRVAVAGFGLTPEAEQQSAGRPADVTGSVDFVAPERARGIPSSGIAADLWSLGATLYAVVEGRLPFHRSAALATLTAVVTDEPPPPRRAGALRPVIDGLLIKDPAHRLGVADARRMLDGVVRGMPVVPAPRRASSGAVPGPHNGAVPRSAASAETVGRPTVGASAAAATTPRAAERTAVGAVAVGGAGAAPAATGALESGTPAGPVGVEPARVGATGMAGSARTDTAADGTPGTGTAGTSTAGTSTAGTSTAGTSTAEADLAGADAGGPGAEAAGPGGMAGAEAAAGGPGGAGEALGRARAPDEGAVEEQDSEAPESDVEIHDPAVAAALAAFEAALGPIPQPRSPAAAGPDAPASPATTTTRPDAPASPATGPDAPASPATTTRPDAPTPPATIRPDAPASPTAAHGSEPTLPAAGHASAPPAAGHASAPPAARPDHAPAPPALPSPKAADTRKADTRRADTRRAGGPPLPPTASKPPTRPEPVPRASAPAPPARTVNGRSATAAPPARNGRTTPLTRPVPARPGPTPFPTPPPPRIEELAGGETDPRRRSVLAALVVTLAVVAAVLIPFLVERTRDDASGSPPQAVPSSAPSTDRASSSPSPEAAAPPPAGFRLHRDRTGFSIAIPSGWREERDGSIVDFRDPTSSRFIRIDQRADPRTDPYEDWIGLEPTYKRRLPGYDLLRIANVQYRGWRTADWEFTWGARGSERSHVLIRNVVPNQFHGYALYWSTTDSEWTKDLPYFDIFVRSFAPSAGR